MTTNAISNLTMVLAALCLLSLSCTKEKADPKEDEDIQTPHEQYFDGKYYHDIPNEGWEEKVKSRADVQLMQWTPLKDVAGSFLKPGLYFSAGSTVTGVPYSSVKHYFCSLGRDVSFYTFLSSVRNPKSLLYTTDYRTPDQYRSISTYYGNTCASADMYCWGLKFQYNTGSIYNHLVPAIKQRKSDDLLKIQLFDVVVYWIQDSAEDPLLGGGHAMMIYDIARNKAGRIMELSVFESAHPTSRLTKYTVEQYQARLDEQEKEGNGKYHVFYFDHKNFTGQYALPSYMENGMSSIAGDYPTALCVDRGDRVSYAQGENVTINILSGAYSTIELYKDGSLFRSSDLSGTADVIYEALPVGLYEACLANGSSKSDRTRFEIGPVDFSVSYDGKSIILENMEYTPLSITINSGEPAYEFPVVETSPGVWKYTGSIGEATHVRVHFAGKYSRFKGKSIKFRSK